MLRLRPIFASKRSAVAAPTLEHRELALGGLRIPYTLRRSSRRSLGLTIDERGLIVAVPLRTSEAALQTFLAAHQDWIANKLAQRAHRAPPPPLALDEGACFPLLGAPCTLHWVVGAARAQWREGPEGRSLHLPLRPAEHSARLLLRRVLQAYALDDFGTRLQNCLRVLETIRPGIAPPKLWLSAARTRWGSCSSKSGIRLNWRLIHFPPALIDYVVAHEVAHLVEMNHSKRFWAVVEALYPNYDAARTALKQAAPTLPEI